MIKKIDLFGPSSFRSSYEEYNTLIGGSRVASINTSYLTMDRKISMYDKNVTLLCELFVPDEFLVKVTYREKPLNSEESSHDIR